MLIFSKMVLKISGMSHTKFFIKNLQYIRIPGEGTSPDTDGFILSKYEDIAFVVKDILRFPPPVMKNTDLEKAGVSGFNAEKDDIEEEESTKKQCSKQA